MNKAVFLGILKQFVLWRTVLFLIAFLSVYLLPVFGDRFPYFDTSLEITGLPNWVWGFGNFDGAHYLRIAQNGYEDAFTQAFFPLFPILIKMFSYLFPKDLLLDTSIFTDPAFFYSGLILSNFFALLTFLGLYKLFRLDFDVSVTKKAIFLILLFPTSYYLASIYAEPLLLFLSICSIYFIRKKKFVLSSVFIALASLTKVFGILLIIVYVLEALRGKLNFNKILGFFLSFGGLFAYMYYLFIVFGNPFYFITSQTAFGAERLTGGFVLLPQVIYRYMHILFTVYPFSLTFFNAFLELVFTVGTLGLLIILFKKMRLSYWLFTLAVLLLPTLTGTLLSMPRFVLLGFLLAPILAKTLNDKAFILICVTFTLLGVILLSLFVRGYLIA